LRLSLYEFADRMNEAMPVIIREFARRQVNELYKGKITLPQFLVLEYLYREGPSKMSRLADFMHVTTAAMTGIMDRLVRDGYCLRVYEPQDRRIINIRLTTRGQDLVKKIRQQRRNMVIKIFGKIAERDRLDYLRIIMQIKDILMKEKEADI
jgi:DNA-binding MarR family transcriptional regulator